VTKLFGSGLAYKVATISLTLAVCVNTFVKAGMFMIFGNRKVAFRVMSIFGLIVAAGALSLIFV
jgi:uncharacterized membrane protein (DUF4010 family)